MERFEQRGDGSKLEEVGGKMEEEVLDEDSKKEADRGRGSLFGMEACTKKREVQSTKVGRRLLGKNLRLVQRIQPAASAKHA